MKWSLAFKLYIESFVFHVHSYQDQFIQPGLLHVCLSLGNGIIVHYGYYGPLIGSRRPLGGRSIRDGSNDLECQ